MQKIQSLQLLRAVAAIAVVLYHATVICEPFMGQSVFHGLFLSGYKGIDLFFVLSGFIIATVHNRDLGHPGRLANYLFNRISRVYPAVIIMTLAALVVYASGFGGSVKDGKLSVGNFVSSILLLPHLGSPLVNVSWTLKYEMIFYMLFALCLVNIRLGAAVLVIWQVATAIIAMSHNYQPTTLMNYYFQPIVLDFGIGILTAAAFMRLENGRSLRLRIGATVGGVLATSSILAFYFMPLSVASQHGVAYSLGFGIASGVLILSLSLLERNEKIRIPGLAIMLGDASYSIYMVHFAAISLLAALANRMHIAFTSLTYIVLVLAGIAMGMLFHRYIDTVIHGYLRSRWKAHLSRSK